MKLWVFGDSFTHDIKNMETSNVYRKEVGLFPPFQPLENNWVNIVSEKLTGTVEHENFSMAGCANEFIYDRLYSNIPKFKEGDYVLVSLTASNRRWLVERCPQLANWSNCRFEPNLPDSVTKDENAAILQYGKYLHSDTAAAAIYTAIFWATVNIAQHVANLGVKFLILPGFEKLDPIKGTLSQACFEEFDNETTLNEYYKKTTDSRWNHFSEVNHKVLANKVIDYFTDVDHNIDLTVGFEKNIYTKDNI
jgi:hypothetical protein